MKPFSYIKYWGYIYAKQWLFVNICLKEDVFLHLIFEVIYLKEYFARFKHFLTYNIEDVYIDANQAMNI